MAIQAIAAAKTTEVVTNNWKPITLTLLAVGAVFYLPGKYKKVRAKNYANKNAGNPNLLAAAVIYESFVKVGYKDSSLLSYIFPETHLWADEDQLYNIAQQVTSINDVAEAYNILFDSVLLNDLRLGLSTEEMRNFYAIIENSNYNDSNEVYLIGEKMYCAKERITVKEVELKEGTWLETGELYDNYVFRDYIGKVHDVGYYEEEDKHFYIVRFCYLYTGFNCAFATYGILWQDQVTNIQIV